VLPCSQLSAKRQKIKRAAATKQRQQNRRCYKEAVFRNLHILGQSSPLVHFGQRFAKDWDDDYEQAMVTILNTVD